MPNTAEVVGGGVAGLTVATLLKRQGWRVTVHEKSDAIREVGAGLYLRNNPLRVLEKMSLDGEVLKRGLRLTKSEWRGPKGGLIHSRTLVGASRLWMCPRQDLIQTLLGAAKEAGVGIELGSEVTEVDRAGGIKLANGTEREADLIVVADGGRSSLRPQLSTKAAYIRLPTVASRFLIDNRTYQPTDTTTMYWSRTRRVGVAACGDGMTYVYLIALEADSSGVRLPIDVATWSDHFPNLRPLFESLIEQPPLQNHYHQITNETWSDGRAVLLGDAAHGLTPLLGQGAGLAMSNAYSLASRIVDQTQPFEPNLRVWERSVRKYTDSTQRWSAHLDTLSTKWPPGLQAIRTAWLWAIDAAPFLHRWMRSADRYPI